MKTQLWMLDYGYKVRVLDGKNKYKIGYIVMDSRFGDVGINTAKKPDRNYQIREHPSNLEIISIVISPNALFDSKINIDFCLHK